MLALIGVAIALGGLLLPALLTPRKLSPGWETLRWVTIIVGALLYFVGQIICGDECRVEDWI
jgi:hypothetical protein